MSLDSRTFSATPAGLYLARILTTQSEAVRKQLVRSCSVRLKQVNVNVQQIEQSVQAEQMTAHVACNLLRLLRTEATGMQLPDAPTDDLKIINQLMCNVAIGRIKQSIRKVSTLRKIEIASVNENKLARHSTMRHSTDGLLTQYSMMGHNVGVSYMQEGEFFPLRPELNAIDDPTTPELLMERSNKRCLRLGKSHMVNKQQ